MTTKYWQGELHKHGGLEPWDQFPKRETAEEAIEDVRQAFVGLCEADLEDLTGGAAEWETDDDGESSANTGNYVEFQR